MFMAVSVDHQPICSKHQKPERLISYISVIRVATVGEMGPYLFTLTDPNMCHD